MAKNQLKQAVKAWFEKGKQDGFFSMKPMDTSRATVSEAEAYAKGYEEGKEQRQTQRQVERNA